jgi:hypothetical protein
MARQDGNLAKAIYAMIVAFFELCFTGKAVCAWRIARARADVQFSPPPLLRLIIVIAFAMVIICGALFSVERPDGQSLNKLEDGTERNLSTADSGTATEGQSSRPGEVERAVFIGCMISAAMIVGGIYLSASRKESRYGKEEQWCTEG